MTLVGLLGFALLGILLNATQGHYSVVAILLTLGFLALVVEMLRARAWIAVGALVAERLLAATAAVFCTVGAFGFVIDDALNDAAVTTIRAASAAAGVCAAVACILMCTQRSDRRVRTARWLCVAAIVALAGAELIVPRASPSPPIDVWVNNTAAADYAASGVNPYTQRYVDIYDGRYAYAPGFLYPPAFLLWIVPSRAAFGDIRFALIATNWLAAWVLFRWARPGRDASLVPILTSLVWLSFPVTSFVIEQSWTDLALVPLSVLAFLAARTRRASRIGAAGGAVAAIKQYGCVAAAFVLLATWKRDGSRTAVRAAAIAAAIVLATVVPFLLLDARAFLAMTVFVQADQPIRLDALNFTAFARRVLGWVMPAAIRIALAIAGASLGAARVLRGPGSAPSNAVAAAFIAYGFAFVFGKWAFCNYYFFLASLLLMHIVAPPSHA